MVECTALEMRRAFTGTVGSNPTLSATGPSFNVIFGIKGKLAQTFCSRLKRHYQAPCRLRITVQIDGRRSRRAFGVSTAVGVPPFEIFAEACCSAPSRRALG